MNSDLLKLTDKGIFCPRGNFYIDPWKPVETAIVTHAHSDHAHAGHKKYYSSIESKPFIEYRLKIPHVEPLDYSKKYKFGDVWVSLHPAGHVIGSSQVRVEYKNEVWVFTGDFKRDYDSTCKSFEVVKCSHFISEATFALPIYSWVDEKIIFKQILDFAESYQGPTILFGYAFGKAQRILSGLTGKTALPIFQHGAVLNISNIYSGLGVNLGTTQEVPAKIDYPSITIAPPSAHRSVWMKRFKSPQTGFASGWMKVKAQKKRGGYDAGFVLSDHADWPDLIRTVKETEAKEVFLTHGQTDVVVEHLKSLEIRAQRLKTQFSSEEES